MCPETQWRKNEFQSNWELGTVVDQSDSHTVKMILMTNKYYCAVLTQFQTEYRIWLNIKQRVDQIVQSDLAWIQEPLLMHKDYLYSTTDK